MAGRSQAKAGNKGRVEPYVMHSAVCCIDAQISTECREQGCTGLLPTFAMTYGWLGSIPELSKQIVEVLMGPPSSCSAQKLRDTPG